jgi:hypothetical protein
MESALTKVEGILAAQRSLVTWEQLVSAEVTEQNVRRMVKQRVLTRVRPGVYVVVGAPDSWERGLLAAVLSAGTGARASHGSSARLWQYRYWPEDCYEILVPGDRRPRIVGVRVHRTTRLHDEDVAELCGIPCTSFERTLCDCTTTLSEFQLGRNLDDGLRRGIASLTRLKDCAERLESGPGRHMTAIRSLLAVRDANYHPGGSASELRILDVVRKFNLPEPVQQFPINVRGKHYVLDYAWPTYRVFAEWYGLPFHIGASRVRDDNARTTALVGLGWLPAVFTDGATEREIGEGIENALRQRGFGR